MISASRDLSSVSSELLIPSASIPTKYQVPPFDQACRYDWILCQFIGCPVVGVAPPLDSGPLGCERFCQLEQGLVKVVIDDGLLSRCVNRAGRTGFGSPAELSITVVFLLESPVDVTEVA